MLANVTVCGKGWSARYWKGKYYSANNAVFFADKPEAFAHEDKEVEKEKPFSFDYDDEDYLEE